MLLPGSIDWVEGALIEPLEVGLHAVNMSSDSPGKRVLIPGAGPVGLAVSFWCRFMDDYHVAVSEAEQLRRDSALQFGAYIAVPAGAPAEVLPGIEKEVGGAPDVVFDCVGIPGMIAGLMAKDKIAVTDVCTATVGFANFADAFESLRTPNAHCKTILDPSG